MLLGFKQLFPWHTEKNPAPTFFREKIITCGAMQKLIKENPSRSILPYPKGTPGRLYVIEGKEVLLPFHPKIHTFREDPHDRWKPGMSIQMVYRGANYKIKDHFNKGIVELEKCISTQKIEIYWSNSTTVTSSGITHGFKLLIFIDGNRFSDIESLAINDGFNDKNQFCQWFNKNWKGKIIHFTNHKY